MKRAFLSTLLLAATLAPASAQWRQHHHYSFTYVPYLLPQRGTLAGIVQVPQTYAEREAPPPSPEERARAHAKTCAMPSVVCLD